MKRGVYFILIVLFCVKTSSQNLERFQEVYVKTYLETSLVDFDKALEVSDSLFQISETPLFKARSLMLTASLYQNSGDLNQAIKYALQAEKHIEKTDDHIWNTRILGFLATQYRLLKLNKESKRYAEKAYNIAQDIKENELANSILGMMLQEIAYTNIEEREYDTAIENLNKAHNYFQELSRDKEYLLSDIEQMLGNCYFQKGDYNQSLTYYSQALETFGDGPNNYLKGMMYNGLGNVYLVRGELDKAQANLSLAYSIAESSNHPEFQVVVYKSFIDYFTEVKDIEQLIRFSFKRDSINNHLNKTKMSYVDKSFSDLKSTNELITFKVSNRNYIIGIVSFIGFSLLALFIIYRYRQKNSIEKFKQIISKLNEEQDQTQTEKLPIKVVDTVENEVSIKNGTSKPLHFVTISMPIETEQRILDKLKQFESSTKFTKNSVSLSSLAVYCETNTKYLSQVINLHKKMDFNNYINELRVEYIIKKLKNEPIYRKYKIATLAEEAGFSSQNKFSTIFKKVTSISPSIFIKYLQEEVEV